MDLFMIVFEVVHEKGKEFVYRPFPRWLVIVLSWYNVMPLLVFYLLLMLLSSMAHLRFAINMCDLYYCVDLVCVSLAHGGWGDTASAWCKASRIRILALPSLMASISS